MKLVLSAVLWCCILFSCNRPMAVSENVGGGGSEVEVRGMVFDNANSPATPVQVRLFTKNFNPIVDSSAEPVLIDTTDRFGGYRFHAVRADTYTIVAVHVTTRMRAIVSGLSVTDTDTVTVPAANVNRAGTIVMPIPDSADAKNGRFYIPGTAIVGYSRGSSGYIWFDSVPPGTIAAIACYATGRGGTIVRYGVTVNPGDTTVIANAAWKYAHRLYLNTTPSGADVRVSITGYPVLVRLTKNNFDFSQACADGRDVRFCKADNTVMAFEIDRWDSAARRAEVWVRTDTVLGNDSTHYMNMFWGNPTAASVSSVAAVFDTSLGIVADVHGNADYNGVSSFPAAVTNFGATAVEGLIGKALYFDGTDSMRIEGLLGKPASITIGAWVQSSIRPAAGYEIVSVGDAVCTRMDFVHNNAGALGCFHLYASGSDTSYSVLGSGRYLSDGLWHYVAYTFDAVDTVQTLYIDGAVAATGTSAASIDYSGVGVNTLIGKHGNGGNAYNFVGMIDEIRISKACRSAYIFKLNYMSQKPDDKLVVFK